MAHIYEVHEAQTHLSKRLKLVEAGEGVVIVREGKLSPGWCGPMPS